MKLDKLSILIVLVFWINAARGSVEFEVRAQLVPKQFATMGAQVSSRLENVLISEGDFFSAGDVLVEFDDALQRTQLSRAKAELAAAQHTAQANRRLRELNSIGQIELELSLAEVDKAAADLRYIETLVERCKLLAPFDGRVSELMVQEKEFVQVGQPILEIVSGDTPEIEFLAPSRWLRWLKEGAELEMHVEETDMSYPAKVSRIGARVDAVSQSIKIRALFTGHPQELMPGMSGVILMASEK